EPLGRLTKRAEFQRVSRGDRVSVGSFTLQSRRREGTGREAFSARIGLTVTKSVGGAVERNRIRRRLKEALRAAAPLEAEKDRDYVLMARREALARRFAALVEDVREAFRAVRRDGAQGERWLARRTPKGEGQPTAAPGASLPGAPAPSAPETVSQVLAASPRVAIDTPSIGGSIDLKGGKIDDIILKDYRQTIDPKSPNIRLFSPPGAPDAYWAETGFVSASGVKTPNLDSVWTTNVKTLTPEHPVTLTWDNGAGLIFKRVIAVDDKYMFTVADSVMNSGAAPATVQPFGLILRHGRPNIAGYSVLHEGLVRVITGDG